MAGKNIDLTGGRSPQNTAAGMQTPPPPRMPDVIHALPLATGQVVRVADDMLPAHMTPHERMALAGSGMQHGEALPPNVASLVQAIKLDSNQPRSPVPDNFVPQLAETVDISQLSPSEQAHYRTVLNDALAVPGKSSPQSPAGQRQAPDVTAKLRRSLPPAAPEHRPAMGETVTFGSQAIPGYQDPSNPNFKPTIPRVFAQQGQPVGQPTPMLQQNTQEAAVVELPAERATYVPPPPPPQPEPQTPAPPPEPPMPAFGDPTQLQSHCPHCDWDLTLNDIPEPSMIEKQAFVQSLLGQKPYLQEYQLLGGAIQVRFRTLTTREIDLIYKQAAYEARQGLIKSMDDYTERVNRFRLYLQLLRVDGGTAFLHDLPEGLSPETNPHADTHWKAPQPDDPAATVLPIIEEFILNNVMRTEGINRVLQQQCSKFNRLVSKLEAMVDNADFWKRTGGQS